MALNINDGKVSLPTYSDFDTHSGSFVERILFNNRPIILFLCLIVTLFAAFEASQVKLNASFQKMIPTDQPFIVNYLRHYNDLQSQGNAVEIAVQADHGTIINAQYMETLKEINDQIFLLPNVDRAYMTSLWTPSTRWTAVTSNGFTSAPVVTDSYDGSSLQLQLLQQNIIKTGRIGSLVSNDFTSSILFVPLLEYDGLSKKKIDYGEFSKTLEQLGEKYSRRGITFHIIGFAMVVGDMINAIGEILAFFFIALIIAAGMLFWFTRCIRSTLLVVSASLIAVIWQMGFLPILGFDLTPYSVLVPFLVFAIGMSHGAQKMNGVMQDIGRGAHPLVAARYTFRRLFLAGFSALICDATSFAVLLTIHITAIRELALLASIGVGILILTNLIMLPMMLSYTGVSNKAANRSLRDDTSGGGERVNHYIWNFLDRFTKPRFAAGAITFAVLLGGVGLYVGRNVQVGDINQGAPELRQNSVYNKDNAYVINHYSTSSDTLVVMVDSPPGDCIAYSTLLAMSNLGWRLQQLPQVQSVSSLGEDSFKLTMLLSENSPKWFELVRNQAFLNDFTQQVSRSEANFKCSFAPIYVTLVDHKAATLDAVIGATQRFINNPENQSSHFKISLAGGNAGIDAATNIVVEQANRFMLLLVYASVIVFCWIVFRSWRAVLCAVLPLILTSILAQALMVVLGIGIKVATLPVVALGVGIGVDYALYVLTIVLKQLRDGATLSYAYHRTLLFTGKVVLLTGFTLAAGTVTWMFAPIKFQADMGLLLSFMFLWNMLGAMILLPSLAVFLLPPHLFKKKEIEVSQNHAAVSKIHDNLLEHQNNL